MYVCFASDRVGSVLQYNICSFITVWLFDRHITYVSKSHWEMVYSQLKSTQIYSPIFIHCVSLYSWYFEVFCCCCCCCSSQAIHINLVCLCFTFQKNFELKPVSLKPFSPFKILVWICTIYSICDVNGQSQILPLSENFTQTDLLNWIAWHIDAMGLSTVQYRTDTRKWHTILLFLRPFDNDTREKEHTKNNLSSILLCNLLRIVSRDLCALFGQCMFCVNSIL